MNLRRDKSNNIFEFRMNEFLYSNFSALILSIATKQKGIFVIVYFFSNGTNLFYAYKRLGIRSGELRLKRVNKYSFRVYYDLK